MADKLKEVPKKLLALWNKYTSKQKTIIISVVCIVVFAFIVLIVLSGRIKYEELTIAEDTKQASEIIDLLDEEGIANKLASDKLTVSVDIKKYSDAVLLIASNDMPSTGITLDELLNNSLSTTNSDRSLKINLFLQNKLRKFIITMNGVEDAEIFYIPVDNSNTILVPASETNASILLKTNDDFEPKSAETIAKVVAASIGNSSSEKIKIADQNGNLLFGGEEDLYSGSAASKEDYRERLTNTFENNLYMILLKYGFDDVEIAPHLVINSDKMSQLFTEYLPADGQEQGLYSHSYTYNSENAGSSGGVPGTTSNDEVGYMIEDATSSNGTVEIEEYDYIPNERVTNIEFETGVVDSKESTVSLVLKRITQYTEEKLETQGLLEDTTFEEYVYANDKEIKLEVEAELIKMVSFASGIAEENIQIVASEQPIFIPKVVIPRSFTDYLQYILAALIVALILFVVFKGFGPVEVTELEPELSVEQLLATTRENQSIEDIEFNEVSEVRRMIEKFVDEKPDAVAQLLRNWLNDEWN